MTDSPPAKRARSGRKRVIIDTDPGIDDMMALLFALKCDELTIEGLTIVMGNHNDVDLMSKNACLALTMCGRSKEELKVYKGACKPLQGDYDGHSGIEVHGENGLGNVDVPDSAIDLAPLDDSNTSAAQFMIDTCAKYPGEVTIIALGPLTNVAKAAQVNLCETKKFTCAASLYRVFSSTRISKRMLNQYR